MTVRPTRDAQLIGHVLDAADALGDVFSAAHLLAARDRAHQRHHALFHLDRNLRCVQQRIIGHAIANLFAGAIVGTLIDLGAASREVRAVVLPPIAAPLARGPRHAGAVAGAVAAAFITPGRAAALRAVAQEIVALVAGRTVVLVCGV